MKKEVSERLKSLPAVEKVLNHGEVKAAVGSGKLPRSLVTRAVRRVLDGMRSSILEGGNPDMALDAVAAAVLAYAASEHRPGLHPVINATGVVLHTNLGRASLPVQAIDAMQQAAGYCNLEYNIEKGARGHRNDFVAPLICELTGAEDALVVNNNAAAVLLVISALARGREVIVSRGQLVEIGGSFRVPEVMAQSGAIMREVGTTNKTHLSDYQGAIGPDTAMLLKVHTSNYRVLGFVQEVGIDALVKLGREHNIVVVEDLGSGMIIDLGKLGGVDEPDVAKVVSSGVDVVTFSGDKLLGGPQAGILVGKKDAIEACRRHPLMRALRPDKVTLAALEAVLLLYRDPRTAVEKVPVLKMLTADGKELAARAKVLAEKIATVVGPKAKVRVVDEVSEAGGGSLPLARFPTSVVAVSRSGSSLSKEEKALRDFSPPIVARVKEDALLFDPRTLNDGEFDLIAQAVGQAFNHGVEGEE